MENVINQRIKEIIRLENTNDKDFAIAINVPQNTLSQIFSRGNYPKSDLILSILTTYPNISAEWLMRGEGEMLRTKRSLPVMNEYNKSDMDLIRELREDKKMLQDYVAHLANSVENLTTNKKE